jgi:hypothetical protein
MGASAMLAGYCRLTYSLAVIMLETTQSINLFLPIIFTILSSFGVARIFNRSLYDYALRGKQMPILRNHAPKQTMYLHAKDFMTPEPIIVEGISTVDRLAEVLNTPFNVFPVLNMAGNVMGMIPRNFMIVLIERLHWYELKGDSGDVKTRYTSHYKKQDTISAVNFSGKGAEAASPRLVRASSNDDLRKQNSFLDTSSNEGGRQGTNMAAA